MICVERNNWQIFDVRADHSSAVRTKAHRLLYAQPKTSTYTVKYIWIVSRYQKKYRTNLSNFSAAMPSYAAWLLCVSFTAGNDLDMRSMWFLFSHKVRWLNAYNEKIRKMVGTELQKTNNSQLGYEWMMDRTMPLFSDGRRNEVCTLAALLVAVAAVNLMTV